MAETPTNKLPENRTPLDPAAGRAIQMQLLAANLQKAFSEEEGQYKGYLIDPTVTVSAMLGRNYRIWRPAEEQLFNLVEGSTINTLIHQTRKDQMMRMTQYEEHSNNLGWRIVHKDFKSPKFTEPKDAKKKIEILRGLFEKPHKLGLVGGTYASFINMYTDFTLTVDKVPIEIIKGAGKPSFAVYDPCTIRPILEMVWQYYKHAKDNKPGYNPAYSITQVLEAESEKYQKELGIDLTTCSWVQYYNQKLIAAWTEEEMIVSVNNPCGRMELRGHGISRAESSILALDAWLKAWGYNVNMFTSGMSLVKGILAAVGNYTEETVDLLKMNLESQVRGPGMAGRFPIIGIPNEKGLQWIRFDPHNQEMEFMQWLDYCTSLVCGIYRVNPQELNLASRSQAFSGAMMSHRQDELVTQTKEEGWHSLLIESALTNNRIIEALGPDFTDYRFIYTGLDTAITETEKAQILQSKDYMAENEKRKSDNLDMKKLEIEVLGQTINIYEHSSKALQTFVSLMQAKTQADQAEQMAQQMGGGEEGMEGAEGEEEQYGEAEQPEEAEQGTTEAEAGQAESETGGGAEQKHLMHDSVFGDQIEKGVRHINIRIVKDSLTVDDRGKIKVLKGKVL